MNKRADTIRIAVYLSEKFGIYTSDPKRISAFAKDLLAKGETLAINLQESVERAAQWN